MTNLFNLRRFFLFVAVMLVCGSAGADTYPLSSTELARRIAAKEQITDVPTIYIDVPTITDETTLSQVLYKIRKGSADEEEIAPYSTATITVVDNSAVGTKQHLESFTDEVQIKVRGNSTASAGNGKLPYRLKFAKTGADGISHKHDLLGYGYSKRNWALVANNFDRSMLRNAVTYHIGQYIGMDFCPGYKYVDLVISGLYRGTYIVSDHCETGSNRVDVANEDTDWYLEFTCWGQMAEAPYIGMGDGDDHFVTIKNPEPETEAEIEQLKSEVQAWRKEWIASFSNGSWQKYNDVESFIKFYIANEITGDLDGYFVFKGSKEVNGLFKWGPLWDKDLAFGNTTYANDNLSAFYNKTQFEWVFKNNLFKDASFLKLAKAKIDELIQGGLYEKLSNDIDNLVALTTNTRLQNYTKWDITAGSMASEVYTMADYNEHVTVLKNYIKNRITYIQSELQGYIDELPKPTDMTYNPTLTGWEQDGSIPTVGASYNLNISNRTLQGGKWNVLCVPFNATQAQVEEALGCQYELAVHSGMDEDGVTMLFSTPSSLALQCGVPYLIKPAMNVNTIGRFNDVVYNANLLWGQYNGDAVTFDNVHFFNAQIYKKDVAIQNNYAFASDIYIDDASLSQLTGANTWDTQASFVGSRAYITVSDGTTPKIKIVSPEGGSDQPAPVHAQLTDVPTIYITSNTMSADTWDATASMEVFDSNNMIGGDKTYGAGAVSVKFKGDGTSQKPSYRLKFGSKTAFLGTKSGSYKQWVLEANDDDPTMLRNALTEELADQMGFSFTPGCQYADVYVNDHYMGTYQITDRVKVESGRVLAANKDTDWLVEIASKGEVDMRTDGYGDLYVEGTTEQPYIIIKNPDPDDLTDAGKLTLKENVGNYFNNTFWADIQNNVDQASFVNWYISAEIMAAYKQLSDICAYRADAADSKLFFGPLDGGEKAYANSTNHLMDMSDLDTEGSYNGMIFTAADYKVMANKLKDLWEQDWFKQAVIEKWNTLYGANATTDLKTALNNKLTTLAQEIAQTMAYNYKPTAQGGAGWTLSGTYDEQVAAIRTYLDTRFAYLDKKFNELAEANNLLIGDVNEDGSLDIADAVAIVNYIVGKPNLKFNINVADVNLDNDVDIADAVSIVNIIVGKPVTTGAAAAKNAAWDSADPE